MTGEQIAEYSGRIVGFIIYEAVLAVGTVGVANAASAAAKGAKLTKFLKETVGLSEDIISRIMSIAARVSTKIDDVARAPRKAVTGMDNRGYSSLAEQQYDAIRALYRSDIETVASTTGLSVAEVTAMKKHLFYGKHQRFAPEVGKVIRKRFDANDEIAEAWIRAQNGPLNARQQQWFRQLADHELAERTMMGQGMPFQDLSAWQRVNGQWEHVFREGLQGAHELAPRTPKFWPFFD